MNTPTPSLHYMNTVAVAQRRDTNPATGARVSWFGRRMAVGCHKFKDTFILFPVQSNPPPSPLQYLAISSSGLGTLAMHGPGRLRHGMSSWNAITLMCKDPSFVVFVPVSRTSTFLGWAVNQNIQTIQSYAVSRTIPEMSVPQQTLTIIRATFCRIVCPSPPRSLPPPTIPATTVSTSASPAQSYTDSIVLDNNHILNTTTTSPSSTSGTAHAATPTITSPRMMCPRGPTPHYQPPHHPMHDIDTDDLEDTDVHDCSGEAFSKAFEYASSQQSACNIVRDTLMVAPLNSPS
jgi:hypothetical protein